MFSLSRTRSSYYLAVQILLVVLVVFQIITYIQAAILQRGSMAYSKHLEIANSATQDLQTRMEVYIQALYGARGFLVADNDAGRLGWKYFYQNVGITKRLPGISSISYLQLVPAEQKKAFVDEMRSDTSLLSSGNLEYSVYPDTQEKEYLLVKFAEPSDSESVRKFLGFNFYSEEVRKIAVEKARDTGQPILTGALKSLVTQQLAFVLVMPVYDPTLSPKSITERQQAFKGVVTSGFRPPEFFGEVFGTYLQNKDFSVEVFDKVPDKPELLIYSSLGQPVISSKLLLPDDRVVEKELNVADRKWILRYTFLPKPSVGFSIPFILDRVIYVIITVSILGLVFFIKHRSLKK